MTIPKFCFDTADATYINSIWTKLKKNVIGKSVVGITTNPNAFNKVGVKTIADMESCIGDLAGVYNTIHDQYTTSEKSIHIQVPISTVTAQDLYRWLDFVVNLSNKYNFTPVIKLPPRISLIECVKEFRRVTKNEDLSINITGLTDSGTCLNFLRTYANSPIYPLVKYTSIIPGRMEEFKLNADSHLENIALFLNNYSSNFYVIAGSMRTIDGLKKAIRYKTLPTIGTRVWDLMTDKLYEEFPVWWQDKIKLADFVIPPEVSQLNIDLSIKFFTEMDGLGESLWKDFNK